MYLVSFVDQLMCTRNELEPIHVVEFCCNFISKKPSGTTRADSPSFYVFRVAPNQVTKSTLMRNFLSPGYDSDLVDSSDLWAETTMNAENLAIYDCSQNQKIKDLATCLPYRCISILLLTFLVESVDLRDLP